MPDNTIRIEVNGVGLDARPGEMLIAVTDRAGIYVPRFCYHPKLSIAANCRMCLVEVANAPKPLPACATPVTNGMKVETKSAKAIGAQKATMEFLLINHPLDCPICDQGGECELQDLAMGFGRDVARFTERKRVVKDKDIGPLVSTDMTRCIHCTRCVRFGQEIAGIQELGTIGRGERMEISTFVEKSVDHELSGNIIDLCPVGALNSKPYRFSARSWEMQALPTVAPHDCVGSNMDAHVLLGKIKRMVPRANEAINETWLADRDRFSYEGVYAADRLHEPMVRHDGVLRPVSWELALKAAADGLSRTAGAGGEGIGAWVSPSSTTEEGFLLQRLFRHLGSDNLDHRLRRRDFRLQERDPVLPGLGMQLADIEAADVVVIVGSDIRREAPLLAHRVRKAALRGAAVIFVNPVRYEYLHPVAGYLETGLDLAAGVRQLADGDGSGAQASLAAQLANAERGVIVLGQLAAQHPRFADLRQAAGDLARQTGARLGYLTAGANSAGLALAGVLPHRGPAGVPVERAGRNLPEMIARPPDGLVLLHVEPEADCGDGAGALAALGDARFVLALTPFLGLSVAAEADVVLPVGTFAETAGTFVNCAGSWQSFGGVASPVGNSRPAWKVLRVLGNLLGMPDCEYATAGEILAAVRRVAGDIQADNTVAQTAIPPATTPATVSLAELDVPMYQLDALLRRATSLQQTSEALSVAGSPVPAARRNA